MNCVGLRACACVRAYVCARTCDTSPYVLLYTAVVYISCVVGPFAHFFWLVPGSAAFAAVLFSSESGSTRVSVFECTAVNIRVFLATCTKVLDSFGFDFLLTLFKDLPGKGNLTTNVLDILSAVARRIFWYFAERPMLKYLVVLSDIWRWTVSCSSYVPISLEFVVRKEARNFLHAFSFSAVSSFPVPRIHPSPVEIGLLETTVHRDVLSHEKSKIDDNTKDLCLGGASIECSPVRAPKVWFSLVILIIFRGILAQ
jgi:hypothetical protein